MYLPATNFVGADSFTYRAHDGAAFSEIATVTLVISIAISSSTRVTPRSLPLCR